jgi:hypothetical protein
MSNSIGDLKNSGLQGNNWPWQYKMLAGLQAIVNAFTGVTPGAVRTPNILTEVGPGNTPTGAYSFSIANVGSATGNVNGQPLPAGSTINYNAELNNTLTGLSYDATGTIFLITWIQ